MGTICILRPGNCRALYWQRLGELLSPIIATLLRIHTKAFELRLVNTFVSYNCEYVSYFSALAFELSLGIAALGVIRISDVELTCPLLWAPTCEVDVADVLEQQSAIDGVHFRAEANFSWTEVFVHAVQSVSHRINGVDHKLNLPLLLVGRILPDSFVV